MSETDPYAAPDADVEEKPKATKKATAPKVEKTEVVED